jgi:hypothetical protein
MEQTFADLWNERTRGSAGGSFVFLLATFAETGRGLVREHILVVKEKDSMQNVLAALKVPATIGFLLVLPFMVLEVMIGIVTRLDHFTSRNALDFAVIFGFLWLGLTAIAFVLTPVVRAIRAVTPANVPSCGAAARSGLANPKASAIAAFVLALPFMTLLSLLVLGVEPPLGPLRPLLDNPDPDRPDVVGSLVVLGTFLLAVVACVVARGPIVGTLRAGGGLLAHPANLVVTVTILSFLTTLVAGIAVDQFPCWMGVPNCD